MVICPGGLEHGGGIGRQMGYFLHAPRGRRADVTYRVVDSRGPWFLGAARRYVALSVFYLAAAMFAVLRARLSPTPHLIHVNITGRGSTFRKSAIVTVAQVLGMRYLLHVHDYDYVHEYRSRGHVMQAVIRRLFGRAAHVLVLGEDARTGLLESLPLAAQRITVLHNAVPDPRPVVPRPHTGAPCHLLFLGHLSARKGVPELLQALASGPLATLDWRATLAGGGPVDECRRLADQLGIAARVTFPGWVGQHAVTALCAGADILVLPSHAEGLAMSVLEGLSHGLAVVATPVGAHREVIEPEISGVLVPAGDAAALGAALARLVADRALRARLQTGARARYVEAFDIAGYAERLSDLHARLLAAHA
jgi:glycosyltransferase involved in cell wall biosynthesis